MGEVRWSQSFILHRQHNEGWYKNLYLQEYIAISRPLWKSVFIFNSCIFFHMKRKTCSSRLWLSNLTQHSIDVSQSLQIMIFLTQTPVSGTKNPYFVCQLLTDDFVDDLQFLINNLPIKIGYSWWPRYLTRNLQFSIIKAFWRECFYNAVISTDAVFCINTSQMKQICWNHMTKAW